MPEIETHDAIIIGAGPAGISCALELNELRVDYILLDRSNH
ncbi:MAG: NAD(P)-binding domain-containing protein, partial [Terriglobales bacterium]